GCARRVRRAGAGGLKTASWLLAVLLALLLLATACTAASTKSTRARPSAAASTPAATTTPTPTLTPTPTTARTTSPRPQPTTPPPLSAKARAAGLHDIHAIVPDAIVDLRYATPDNFVGVRLYPRDARCLVHTSMTRGLDVAARVLRRAGYLLVFWDCYRPHPVQVRMFQIVPNANWVARPGPYATSHEAGRSVDVTLAYRSTHERCTATRRVQGHCLLAMGTGFDNFTPRAYAFATAGVSDAAQANRATLRHAMADGGLTVYSGEWWHFDGPGALVHRPILGAPLR
ncbi:MAG TPA: M15 family metallopeptidase, partial [Jatrophihabitantaceae bacterium]|nr:M15 family metallopeptidase [Jatrophihabitantaceae bacterium]